MRRLRRLAAHLASPHPAAVGAEVADPPPSARMRFPHCGEMRAVAPVPQSLLDDSLGPGYRAELTGGDRQCANPHSPPVSHCPAT